MLRSSVAIKRVLIVEDDSGMQARLCRLLSALDEPQMRFDVAGDLRTARQLAGDDHDLALVDVQLPDGNGVDLIRWLRLSKPQLPAVVVSSWAAEDTIIAALQAGAIGYLLKNAEDIELSVALHSLWRGGAAIDPMIARRLLELMAHEPTPPAVPADARLSARESEILQFVARGLGNREIAEAIGLSRLTIESHIRNIYRKLEVGSRTEAVFEARSLGLLH